MSFTAVLTTLSVRYDTGYTLLLWMAFCVHGARHAPAVSVEVQTTSLLHPCRMVLCNRFWLIRFKPWTIYPFVWSPEKYLEKHDQLHTLDVGIL